MLSCRMRLTIRLRHLRRRFVAGTLSGLSVALTASAHDTWISPSAYSAAPGELVRFQLTSGMNFPELDSAIKPERVAKAGIRIGAETIPLSDFKPAEHALQFEHSFSQPGLGVVWLQLKPKEIELTDDDVAHYLEESHASEEVKRAWAEQKGKQKWKELYTKCAKAIVAVGDAGGDDSWREPNGLALELVPLANPAAVRQGEETGFRLLRNGEPLANTVVILHYKGHRAAAFQASGSDGTMRFRFEKAGPALLSVIHLRPPREGGVWESEFATLSFEVKPK